MTDEMVISLLELERVVSDQLSHLRRVAGETLSIEPEYFWSISDDELFNVADPPSDLTIGQLSECWASLTRTRTESEAVVSDLVWLADILRAIAARGDLF